MMRTPVLLLKNLTLIISLTLLMSCVHRSAHQPDDADDGVKIDPLYQGDIPGSVAKRDLEDVRDPSHPDTFIRKVTYPTLSVYLPPKSSATGTAVIIMPGGGYGGVSIVKEGYEVAERLNKHGIAAIVLKYRDPLDETMADKKFGPLQDAQQALIRVRKNAAEWNIDPAKVGVMGFSAGGHLASSAAVHYKTPVLKHWSSAAVRPDFQILVYPVISFRDPVAHAGSRQNLLGKSPEEYWIEFYSNERNVRAGAPPAFMVHATDDQSVIVENSISYYVALKQHSVSASMLVLPEGGHGFGMRSSIDWFAVMIEWLSAEAF